MAITASISTTVGEIRFELGDDTIGKGVLPGGDNISDEIIQAVYEREGSVMKAVASLCEALSRRWSVYADMSSGPQRDSNSQVAKAYADRAKELRKEYGSASDATGVVFRSVSTIRQDGYSRKTAFDDVEIRDDLGDYT